MAGRGASARGHASVSGVSMRAGAAGGRGAPRDDEGARPPSASGVHAAAVGSAGWSKPSTRFWAAARARLLPSTNPDANSMASLARPALPLRRPRGARARRERSGCFTCGWYVVLWTLGTFGALSLSGLGSRVPASRPSVGVLGAVRGCVWPQSHQRDLCERPCTVRGEVQQYVSGLITVSLYWQSRLADGERDHVVPIKPAAGGNRCRRSRRCE